MKHWSWEIQYIQLRQLQQKLKAKGNAIYFLAGTLFLFMQLKNESKCFNLIKNGREAEGEATQELERNIKFTSAAWERAAVFHL